MEVKVQSPYPFNLVSSGESEDGEQELEEETDLHAASWHPKPLGVSVKAKTTKERPLSIKVRVGKCNFALPVVAAVHIRMQDVGLQHIHFRPPVAPPQSRLERHVGAAR